MVSSTNVSYIWVGFLVLVLAFGCTQTTYVPEASSEPSSDDTATNNSPPADSDPASTEDDIVEVEITARQWAFEPNPVRVRVGQTVRLHITSQDVAHGFALPDFGVNARLEPGQTTTVEFVADQAGTYRFFCSVFCGAGHSDMNGQLIVEE